LGEFEIGLCADDVRFLLLDVRFGRSDIGFDLPEPGQRGAVVDPGDYLAAFDFGVEIRVQFGDQAGDLGTDIDRNDRADCAGGVDQALDAADGDRLGLVADRTAACTVAAEKPLAGGRHEGDGNRKCFKGWHFSSLSPLTPFGAGEYSSQSL
jgi:hypothetical protein